MAQVSGQEGMTPEQIQLLEKLPEQIRLLHKNLQTRILGQNETVHQLLLSFLAGGHSLIVGVPGLAKTLMIRSLSELFDLNFARIQFTPDLMPSDITGTTILVKDEMSGAREFKFRKGPLFTNLLLADEINRTPPKTQAALLEAMEEFQATVGGQAHPMPSPFFVLATQNPIEQEGTYPLPITQLDRFLFQINIDYPDADTEFEVIASTTAKSEEKLTPILSQDEIMRLLELPKLVHIPEEIRQRATRLVRATRTSEAEGKECQATQEWISWGAGPRAVQAILGAAQACAVMAGRKEVKLSDYDEVLLPALRHRIVLSYHAEAEFITPDQVINQVRDYLGDEPAAPPKAVSEKKNSWMSRAFSALTDTTPSFRSLDN